MYVDQRQLCPITECVVYCNSKLTLTYLVGVSSSVVVDASSIKGLVRHYIGFSVYERVS